MKANDYINDWGFVSMEDLFQSTLHYKNYKPMLGMSLTFGTISAFVDKILGIELMVYLAFLLLLVIEFITGIYASVKEGNKIQSKRLGRFVAKVIIYTCMIAIVNTMKVSFIHDKIGVIYDFIYWTILHLISIQLIVSVFENLSRLGVQESSRVFKRINKFMSKWFDLKK